MAASLNQPQAMYGFSLLRHGPSAAHNAQADQLQEELRMTLSDYVAGLAKGTNLATVVTLMPDGQPQAQLTWIDTDGQNILINTEPQRQRAKNVARDPRVTVLIHVDGDPFAYAEIRGAVTDIVSGARAEDHVEELSQRYLGTKYPNPIGPQGRIILVVTPTRVNAAQG